MKLFSLMMIIIFGSWYGPSVLLAFDDDSTIDLRFFDKGRCKNGTNLNEDSGRSRFACDHTEAFVDSRDYLYKNDKKISNNKIIDFKLSRGGKVFYRKQIDSQRVDKKKSLVSAKLYSEKGLLYSGAGGVLLYLVSYDGDVIYLNENYEIFKNGKPLNAGAFKVPILRSRGDRGRIISPKVSFKGTPIYINANGDLYKEGVRLNPVSAKVKTFLIDLKDNVYYVDSEARLFKNRRKIYGGPHKVVVWKLRYGGGVGFLVDHGKDNLIFQGRKYSAGASRIVSFRFNRSGNLIYRDDRNRRWNNGRQTGD